MQPNVEYGDGCHVWICVPELGWTEYHPYSVASTSADVRWRHQLLIHTKIFNRWTQVLVPYLECHYQSSSGKTCEDKTCSDNLDTWHKGYASDIQRSLTKDRFLGLPYQDYHTFAFHCQANHGTKCLNGGGRIAGFGSIEGSPRRNRGVEHSGEGARAI
jgi:hypothetical protein